MLLRRGDTFATPAPIEVAAAQPAVFLAPQAQAPAQGHIYRCIEQATQPLAALGETGPAVIAGEAAPAEEPFARTVDPVVVTIGGIEAKVVFAGLTPFFSGLYQVNVQVRSGVAPGDEVPLVVSPDPSICRAVTLHLLEQKLISPENTADKKIEVFIKVLVCHEN